MTVSVRIVSGPLALSDPEWKLIQEACERSNGRHTPQSINQEWLEGRIRVFRIFRDGEPVGLVVSDINFYPTGQQWLNIRMGVGQDKDAFLASVPWFEELARTMSLNGVESTARTGWAREFKKLGYSHSHSFLEKRL